MTDITIPESDASSRPSLTNWKTSITTDFRALCAELVESVEVLLALRPAEARPLRTTEDRLSRARAALGEADEPVMPEGKKPTRDELWELWLRLNNELPDRPAAVAEFWEHAQINARARASLADEPTVPEVVGSEWQPCVKLPITVHVREQRPGEQHVSTREGITPVQSDDLIMLGVDGEEYPIGRELFQRTYRMGSADEPAVPEGREPASVTGQLSDAEGPSIEDVEELCEEHCFNVEGYESIECLQGLINEAIARWGHQPAPPADGEVAELVAWLRSTGEGQPCLSDEGYARLTRAAELLQRQVLVPVSVSERPWEREGWCDVEGRFWAEHISRSGVASWRCAAASDLGGWAVRCLPAHSLPVPEVGE